MTYAARAEKRLNDAAPKMLAALKLANMTLPAGTTADDQRRIKIVTDAISAAIASAEIYADPADEGEG